MKFIAEINIMPLKTLLDPQGKAVSASMKNIGLSEIQNVRIGKHITLQIDAENKEIATAKVEEACKSDNKEDIDKAVEELSKIAQPLSDKLFKKEQAQAQPSTDDDSAKDQSDDAVDAEFKEVDEEKDK